MKIKSYNIDEKIFIIAEIGNNHEGSFALAKKLIKLASESGADAVKFQTFVPEYYVSNQEKERLKKLRSFQFSYDQFAKLAEYANKIGIIFFSTPFDTDSALFLNEIQPLFKIASGDNNFFPLIDLVASFGKPIIISTGLVNLDLIDELNKRVFNVWKSKNIHSDLAFLHCVSSYPTPFDQANIGVIKDLKQRYPNTTIGYSDHTLGYEAAVYAATLGARIIEKHFTIDKNYSDFRDHQISSDPKEFKEIVNKIRRMELLMGNGIKKTEKCEEKISGFVRRSIAAKTKLSIGSKLTIDNITWVRPATGIAPGNEHLVLGKNLINSMEVGQIIKLSDIEKA